MKPNEEPNQESCEGLLNYLLNELRNALAAVRNHDKALKDWPSGKSTVDHNIRGAYKVKHVETLRRQIKDLEDKCWNNK